MRLIGRRPEGEPGFDPTDRESLWRPSESLSIVDGRTRDALIAEFDALTGRDDPMRDYYDGVFWIGETRMEYIRGADLYTGLAKDRTGVLQIDAMDPSAPPEVRNMRFQLASRPMAEIGQPDRACLVDGTFGGMPLPGRSFDPKPILLDAAAYAFQAMEERRWQDQLELALERNGHPVRPRRFARLRFA